jgi:SAM-dependent methyltransferase
MPLSYDTTFFRGLMDGSYTSAKAVMPYVISLCQPESIADFGCGVGSWLQACRECGIKDVTGIDGDYVKDQLLMIPTERFVRADLTRPIDLGRRFDLVLSLEVAEHLPREAAPTFVDTLTRHGPVILFSAAIPSQGGVHHVNEQWAQYWSSLFGDHGYVCVDCLRDVFWDAREIKWWYRQNMFLFVSEKSLSQYPNVSRESSRYRKLPVNLIHPDFVFGRHIGLGTLLRQVPSAASVTFRRLFHGFFEPVQRSARVGRPTATE